MRKFVFVLFCLFFWLQYSFWFGKHGVYDFFYIKNSIKIRMINNLRMELKVRNDKFIAEINDFIYHQEASVEECARNKLGLIKSGEVFYRVIIIDKK